MTTTQDLRFGPRVRTLAAAAVLFTLAVSMGALFLDQADRYVMLGGPYASDPTGSFSPLRASASRW